MLKNILTPLLLALLTATTLTSFASPAQVYAIPGPVGGVLDPSNVWAPYGPRVGKLQLNYYADEFVELADFERGNLDLPDWPVPPAKWAGYDANPDIVLSRAQGGLNMFQIDFNHISSDWTAWGCDFDNGKSLCGSEIRKALAHLIDRPQFVRVSVLAGAAESLADPTPPIKLPSGSPVATQQSWDNLHSTIDAFNIATDTTGFATLGSPDFCAARDHLLAAGVGFADSNNDCVIDNPPSTPIRFPIRSDSAPRRQLGIGIMNSLNALFGTDVVAEIISSLPSLADHVFVAYPADDWSVYTGGWSLGGFLADHLRPLYHSLHASDFCGGPRLNRPLNYGFVCVPDFDNHVDLASNTDSLPLFISETLAALDEFGKRALSIPVYSQSSRFAVLRDLAGAVNEKGVGHSNIWTLLNGRDDPSYTPSYPIYTFGGSAGPETLRWGQRQGTLKLNVFHAATFSEFNVLRGIYDTLLIASPIEHEKIISWMVNKYSMTVDAAGDTHIVLDLKANLRFQDGYPLTAEDVRFSIISYRDAGCALLSFCPLDTVRDVVVPGPGKVEIVLQGRSISHLYNINVLVIPKHLWDTNGDGTIDSEKLDPSFDPLAAGILVGSGPWVCRSIFPADLGRIGTGCAQNPDGSRAGQAILPGSKMILEKFDFTTSSNPYNQYMRNYNPTWPSTESGQFQEWSWADENDNAIVDIVDVSSVASCFGKTAPDTACPAAKFAYWDRVGALGSITEEAVRVAARMDETYVDLYHLQGPTVLLNLIPFPP